MPKDTNIYKALNYMLRNYTELTSYIDIPDMPLDNNDTERLIKNPERWLCYVLKNIKTTPADILYTLLPEFWEDEEQ